MILYTSLAEIKSFRPCTSGWEDILRGQGKTTADNELFPLKDCLKSNSVSDVMWLLGKRKKEILIAVETAKLCANSVAHLKNKAAIYAINAVINAAAYAIDAIDAIDTVYAAISATYAATYAAEAADSAIDAAIDAIIDAAIDPTYATIDPTYAARAEQNKKNRQFLLQSILKYESEN